MTDTDHLKLVAKLQHFYEFLVSKEDYANEVGVNLSDPRSKVIVKLEIGTLREIIDEFLKIFPDTVYNEDNPM